MQRRNGIEEHGHVGPLVPVLDVKLRSRQAWI